MRSAHIRQAIASAGLLALGVAAGAHAADLYASGAAGFSYASGSGSARNDLIGAGASGDDEDASPLYGGALGIAVPLSDVIPWALRIPSFDVPYWPGRSLRVEGSESFRFPGWRTLIEAEAITGREYNFTSPGTSGLTPYQSEMTSTSFMGNVRLDVPIQTPLNALFGRLPMLEPVTLFGGGGVGVAWNEVAASDTVNRGTDDTFELAYQVTAGLGYALSDQVHLSFGWRYFDPGEVKVDVSQGPNLGSFTADFAAHEVTTSVRFHFYHVPFFGRE